MSHVVITFRTSNAAFEENPEEVADLLRKVADDGRQFGHVVDTNGNVVGSYDRTYDDPDRIGPDERANTLYEGLKEHLESLGLEVDDYPIDDALEAVADLIVNSRGNREWTP